MFFDPRLFGSYELAILLKLFLSALAGGLIGLEREKRGRPAGLRTNLLVSVGACTVMIISLRDVFPQIRCLQRAVPLAP